MSTLAMTLLVIGGGPGGYVAAIRAAQLGIATILVEGEQLGHGWAHIIDGKTVEVRTPAATEPMRIDCEHLLLATGPQTTEHGIFAVDRDGCVPGRRRRHDPRPRDPR